MEEFINFFKIKKNIINILSLAILVLAIPLGINLVREQQILRSKAAVESIVFTGPNVKEINGRKVATASSIIVQVTAPDDTGSSSSSNSSSSNSSNNSSNFSTNTTNTTNNTSGSGGTGNPDGSALQNSTFQSLIPNDITAEQITAEANQIIGSGNWRTEENQFKLRRNLFEKYFGREGDWLTPQQIAKFKQTRTDIGEFINKRSEGGNADGVILGEWFPGGSRDTDGLRVLLQIAREDNGKPVTTPDQVLAMVGIKERMISEMGGPEGSRDWPATRFLRAWFKNQDKNNPDQNAINALRIMSKMPGQTGFTLQEYPNLPQAFTKTTRLPWELVGTVYAGHLGLPGTFCDETNSNALAGEDPNGEHYFIERCEDRGSSWRCENGQCKSGGGGGQCSQKTCIYSENGNCFKGNCLNGSENCDFNNNCGWVDGCREVEQVSCPVTGCSGRPSGVPANNWKPKDASVSYNCTNNKVGNTCVGIPYQCRNGQWVLYEPPGLAGEPTNVCNGFCSAPQQKYKCVNRTCQVSTDGTGTTDSTCGGTTCTGGGTTPPPPPPPPAATITQFKLVQDVADFDSTNFTSYVRGSVSVPVTFKNVSPGTKTVYVRFYDASGNKVAEKSANIELLGADPVMASCSLDSSGTSVTFEIKGTGFGTDKGTVKHKSNNLNIDDWQDNTVKAVLNNPPTGNFFLLEIAKPNGQKVSGFCSAISQLSLGAKTFCRTPSKHDQSNVDISVIEATSTAVLRKEKVKITKEGLVEGLTIKLEANKKYKIGIKAPKTLRRVVEATAAGGTLSIPNFILPVGDIFPVENGDGKINSLDKAELNRQWVVGIDAANRSGDFNQDSRVNSIDWACMRFDFNKDENPEPKN